MRASNVFLIQGSFHRVVHFIPSTGVYGTTIWHSREKKGKTKMGKTKAFVFKKLCEASMKATLGKVNTFLFSC